MESPILHFIYFIFYVSVFCFLLPLFYFYLYIFILSFFYLFIFNVIYSTYARTRIGLRKV
jgi:hypothetical protein